jgi:hypothetical protein
MTTPDARTTPQNAYDATAAVPPSARFVWHDLMTTDPARSVAFYSALFGWRTDAREVAGAGAYTAIRAGDVPFGGMVPLDPKHGIPSHWVSYVAVDDVDATCARANAAGGRTCIPPTDIPNVGRFAIIEDPDGAILSPISLPNGSAPVEPSTPPVIGTAWWHELSTRDPMRAAAFYRAVFGWRVQEALMSDGAPYWLFMRDSGALAGGMLASNGASAHRPYWTVYVAVADVDDAVSRAVGLGATASFPCTDVPGTGRIGGFVDPTGAPIAVGQSAPM